MTIPYVSPMPPTFQVIIINHFNLLRNCVEKHKFCKYITEFRFSF